MSLSHPTVARFAAVTDVTSVSPARPLRANPPDRRPLRANPLTRRIEAAWLTPFGDIETSTRLSPAVPLFEEACSALTRGTMVLTEQGGVAVEDLVPGMQVLTAGGTAEPVRWIGAITLYPGPLVSGTTPPDSEPLQLTRITADAFGQGGAGNDLILGPAARVLWRDPRLRRVCGIDEAFVPARALVDGCAVLSMRPAAPTPVYHLALRQHAAIRTLGMAVESFHPGTALETQIEPRMLSLFAGLFPHVCDLRDFGPLILPRLTRGEMEHLLD
jgi:hypothetical protein